MGGLSARASGPRMYRLPLMAMVNLSHGMRKEPAAYQVIRPTAIVHPVNNADESGKEPTPESFATAVSGGGARSKNKVPQNQHEDNVANNNPAAVTQREEKLPGSYPKNAPKPKLQDSAQQSQASRDMHQQQRQYQTDNQQALRNMPQQPRQQQQQKHKTQQQTVNVISTVSLGFFARKASVLFNILLFRCVK